MLSFLNEKRSSKDIKTLRSDILDFIKEQLKKAESGEGQNIKGLQLYITCDAKDKFVYEGAVYVNSPDKFKEEVQKIADDFAIDLPASWSLHVMFDEDVPEEIRAAAVRLQGGNRAEIAGEIFSDEPLKDAEILLNYFKSNLK